MEGERDAMEGERGAMEGERDTGDADAITVEGMRWRG